MQTEPAKGKAAARLTRIERVRASGCHARPAESDDRETAQPRQIERIAEYQKRKEHFTGHTKMLEIQWLRSSFHRANSIMRRLWQRQLPKTGNRMPRVISFWELCF
jgi:hypothetical protein